MSKLKAITVLDAYQLEYNDDDLVYLKSEADKAITRHKYKRCLAMAKTCEYRWMNLEKMIDTKYRTKKMRLCERWQRIWLKLAEKFKEAK